MTTHKLKCHNVYFEALWDGTKMLDMRYNDRDYQVGDALIQREYDPDIQTFSGRWMMMRVTHIVHAIDYPGLAPGYVAMSIADIVRYTKEMR